MLYKQFYSGRHIHQAKHNNMNIFLAEFIGTGVMILLGCGVVANVVLEKTKGNNGGWIVITTAWALAVFIGVVIAGPVSGAHLNPAVTLANILLGKMTVSLALWYVTAQFLGSATGSFLVWIIYKKHFDATSASDLKQAVFCTAPNIYHIPSNFLSEMIGTMVLIFTILSFTDVKVNNEATVGMGSLGAIPVALLVWVIGLSLGGTTGYAINPVRDLAPRIVHALLPIKNKAHFNIRYAWIPILAPLTGATLAALLFKLFQHSN